MLDIDARYRGKMDTLFNNFLTKANGVSGESEVSTAGRVSDRDPILTLDAL